MMDALGEVLRSVHLSSGVFLDARFTAPWCVLSKIEGGDCQPFLARPAQLIAYHFVIDGRLLISVDGEPAIEVRGGEIVLLPRNDVHKLASAPGLTPISARELVQPSPDGGLARIYHGGGGEAVHLVCGFLASEERYNPLIASLPPILKIDIREATSRDWVEASVRFAADELVAGKVASAGVISRLSELLLVEAVRAYAATLGERQPGWLKGLADPQIGRALALMHHKLDAPWSADGLAKEVALSRSAFMERFTALVGLPPIRYLTAWRLQTARLHLRETRQSIAQLAHAVGYDSEAAFSRAFKREFGLSPAHWREREAGAVS